MRQSKIWKRFFYYAPFERRAIVFLLVLTIVLFSLPRSLLYHPPPLVALQAEEKAWLLACTEKTEANTVPGSRPATRKTGASLRLNSPFDPNRVSREELLAFGLSPEVAKNWVRYLEKGGSFRSANEVGRIYGLESKDLHQLQPYLEFAGKLPRKGVSKPAGQRAACIPIDINAADSTAWEALPGIGSVLAGRIIRFRNRLGGFLSPEQVGETYGLADSTFARIRPCLTGGGDVTRIFVNSASLEALGTHPYIGFKMAKVLLAYRKQHGGFDSPEALLRFPAWTGPLCEKAMPYLDFQTVNGS